MPKDKILITGFSGFVSRHFLKYLELSGIEADICGMDICDCAIDKNKYSHLNIQFYKVDLLDKTAFKIVADMFKPEYILHLASFSSVAYSWKNPVESFNNNTNIFLNIVSSLQELKLKCRILSIGSSEEYGNVSPDDIPLVEDHKLKPISPYAVARVSQELLSQVYADSYDVDIIMTRSFNHIGPYQDTRFVIPSFVKQIVDISKTVEKSGVIEVGNIDIVRDFVDVRDVVRAYYILLKRGKQGGIYNICSGNGKKLSEIIDNIAKITNTKIETKVNPDYVRLNDNQIVIGSYEKINKEYGWKPEIDMNQTLVDMVNYFANIRG